MIGLTVPLDTMVPISRFGRGGASREFAKVSNGVPVTVLKNSEPAYFIINEHDYRMFREAEERIADMEARSQALRGEGAVFDSIDTLMEDLHA